MAIRSDVYGYLVPRLRNHPLLWKVAKEVHSLPGLARHSAAHYVPQLIGPQPRKLHLAVTAYCNLRCIGCRYGRDFMPNSQLELPMVRDLLDDAKAVGVETARLYGGEPLLHRDLPKMVEHSVALGLRTYVTTNGILLKEKIDDLYNAGLREISIGFYGVGGEYDQYVQRPAQFDRLERGVAYLRQRYGRKVQVHLNWLLMRPSCNMVALGQAYDFAERYDLSLRVDLVHYSLPYFTEGPDRVLQFRPEDQRQIELVVSELIRLKQERPERISDTLRHLRSIPDWLLKGPDMRVPCDAYRLLWVGADGTTQLCYVTFRLGNLHETRLRDMMFTHTHRQAARDAYALNCPNCHCDASDRINKDFSSRLKYGTRQQFETGSHGSPIAVEPA